MLKRHELSQGIIAYEMGLGKNPNMTVWSYRIGKTLIDSGTPSVLKLFTDELLDDGGVEHVYVTHHHEDHSGGAARIRQLTGAKICLTQYCDPLTQNGFRQYPYQLFYWGKFRSYQADTILELPALSCLDWVTPDGRFRLFHTPGHSHDMTVVLDIERRILFTADLFLAPKIKLMRRDEVWQAFEDSLARVLQEADFDQMYCGHRGVFEDGQALLEKKHEWMRSSRQAFQDLVSGGVSEDEARKKVFGRSVPSFERVSLGNVSQRNMIDSLQGRLKARPDVVMQIGAKWASNDFDQDG